ncbi:MAG: penicillin-binding transpeptidase domain-containing protein, partial [Bacteroidota bacterium]|nr:penicillin-binding transpeptidase domain-containing protein [Bacteroidota bacterium]
YSPVRHPERAMKRREVVLYQMKKYNYLTEEEYEKYSKIPFDRKKYRVQDQNVGLATYFRQYLREYMDDWCSKHKKEDGSNYNLYKDGLKIYTTINSRMQRYAEEAVKEHLSKDIQPEFFKQWKGIKNAPFDIQFNNDDDNVIKDKDYYKKHNEERGSVPEIIKNIMESAKKRSERYINLKKNNATEEEIIQIFNTPVRMKVFTWHGDRDTVMTPMDSIRYYKYYLLAGLISIESQTGYVRAYVGGIDYRYFKYDHVVKSKRQVGSTFKPFVYALAMQEGEFSPCSKVPNTPVSFDLYGGQKWTPRNSEKDREGEMVTLKWALANSVNYVSAYLMKRYSPLAVVKLAQKMGVTSPIEPVYSICLGTPELTLYELTGAYNTFVNKGQWIEPIMITRIEDKNRRVLETFIPKRVEAMSEETAFLMIHLMRGVVESGTGARLRFMYNINNPVAGKTGTTQNNSDGWFIGLTPTLSTGVWVGAEDRSVHFKNTFYGQGANTALPIWAYYMKKVYKDKSLKVSQGEFESLSHEPNVELNCKEFESKKHKNSDRFDNENF